MYSQHNQQKKPVPSLHHVSHSGNPQKLTQLQQQQTHLLPMQQQENTGQNTIKFFIQRDFSEGVAVRFSEEYPTQLRGKIDFDRYLTVIRRLNDYYASAESISVQSVLENVFGCLTAYFILLCIPTQYERFVRKASNFIEDANKRLFHPKGIHMGDPMSKGLRCIEMTVIVD